MHIWYGGVYMSSILPLPPAVVGEFVGRAHADLARVSELLGAYPTLIHSAFDWGNGDWETALGAAAHSGRRDIVEYLLSRGGRLDIFTAAYLGKMSLVKAFLHENPEALHLTGPHGISLLDHARKGGDPEMVAFLAQRLDPEGARVKTKRKAAKSMKVKRRKAA
jgi:hypothetical protein